MGLTLLYLLLHAVKSKNSGLKTWFGILAAWNPKSLMKNGGISNLIHDFNLVSAPRSCQYMISGNAVREALDRSP